MFEASLWGPGSGTAPSYKCSEMTGKRYAGVVCEVYCSLVTRLVAASYQSI